MKRAWLMCSHTLFPLVKVIHWILGGVKVMKKTKVKKQKTPKKQGCSLFLLLMLLALAPVVLATVILSTTSLRLTRTNLEGSVQTTLHVTADNLAKYCKENEITAMNASGYYEYLDSLKEEDLEMAILADGIPATTSIKNENDYRIREIPMDQDLVSGGGTEGYYDKNVVIDGNAYYGYYIPIMNDGRITAVAFAAERKNDITDALWEIEVVFLICAAGIVLLFGAICFFLSRALSSRMKETGARVNALAEGDLSAKKESHSIVREIRNLLLNTSQMQRNLAQVIGGVQEVAGELLNSVRQVAEGSNTTMEQAEQIRPWISCPLQQKKWRKMYRTSVTAWTRLVRRSTTSVPVPDNCRRIRRRCRTTVEKPEKVWKRS